MQNSWFIWKVACRFYSTEFWGFVRGRVKLLNLTAPWEDSTDCSPEANCTFCRSLGSCDCRVTPPAKEDASVKSSPRLQAGQRAWLKNCWCFGAQQPKAGRQPIRKRLEARLSPEGTEKACSAGAWPRVRWLEGSLGTQWISLLACEKQWSLHVKYLVQNLSSLASEVLLKSQKFLSVFHHNHG